MIPYVKYMKYLDSVVDILYSAPKTWALVGMSKIFDLSILHCAGILLCLLLATTVQSVVIEVKQDDLEDIHGDRGHNMAEKKNRGLNDRPIIGRKV